MGLVAVVVPSAFSLITHPHRWIMIRWWKAHSSRQFSRLVVPPLLRGDDVMHLAPGWGRVAAGGGAVLVAGDDGAAQVRRHQFGDFPDVQGQAD